MNDNNPPFTIEHNIPIPDRQSNRGGAGITKTLKSLAVGDSFCVDYIGEDGKNQLSQARNSVNSCARSIGMKIACRKVEENKLRVWRIS